MQNCAMLGIDAGGTHTDAVLISNAGNGHRLLARAKVRTCHDDLPLSVRNALGALGDALGTERGAAFAAIGSVTLGTTLAVNALVQGRVDTVGLALSAGPGLAPERFALGDHVCVVPGGLDHRGVEVTPLDLTGFSDAARHWRDDGVAAVACVGKFSPRNPLHEKFMGEAAKSSGLPVTLGHRLSGQLNFPRRIATAYYNAAVQRLHNAFLDAVEQALAASGIHAQARLLKADGGAIPLQLSRTEPVQSILSGPAASVMGVMALCPDVARGCSVLLDIGGTTTDIALFVEGSPVIDRDGMFLGGRRTLVRALASLSIGVGGDSLVTVKGSGGNAAVSAGPLREGPAMAFGGSRPTLLDCLNVLDGIVNNADRGDGGASNAGVAALAQASGLSPENLARGAEFSAMSKIRTAVKALLDRVNARPIYTLAQLRTARTLAPDRAWLVGGPAACLRERVASALGIPVEIPEFAAVANAVGAALTLPTASLEIYVDTGRGQLRAPAYDFVENIGRGYTLDTAKLRACELLDEHLKSSGVTDAHVEVLEADMFATLDDRGYGSRDMRVTSQVVPGIAGRM